MKYELLKNKMEDLGAAFDHVGLVTDDLENTIDYLSAFPDIGPWARSVHAHVQENLIVGTPYALAVGKASVASGNYFYEVVQPIKEECSPEGYFYGWDAKNNGLHHLAYSFDLEANFREALALLNTAGDKEVLHGIVPPKSNGGKAIEYVYLESGNNCGIMLELVCRNVEFKNRA